MADMVTRHEAAVFSSPGAAGIGIMTIIRTMALENRIEDLDAIYSGLHSVLKEAGLPDALGKTLFLVCEELFSNVVRYGYQEDETDNIDLLVECEADFVRMTFRDHATQFDVSVPPAPPSMDRALHQMEIGGLGLYLVHHFSSSVRNWQEAGTNVTEIIVPATPPVSALR
jgi:serine/threonine-protein kinase RsbW